MCMASFLQVEGLGKSFGDLVLFSDIKFSVDQYQRMALVARNGSGKTTLLNIIAGKDSADYGSVVFRNDLRIGYLEQDPAFAEGINSLSGCVCFFISNGGANTQL